MLKIYLTNLGKYNEGYLIGEWVTLPVDDDELEEVKQRIGINEAIEKKDDCYIWFDCSDMEDVAIQYCDTCGMLEAMPEHLRNYFDFAAFGRDMSFEGRFVFLASGNCIEIY